VRTKGPEKRADKRLERDARKAARELAKQERAEIRGLLKAEKKERLAVRKADRSAARKALGITQEEVEKAKRARGKFQVLKVKFQERAVKTEREIFAAIDRVSPSLYGDDSPVISVGYNGVDNIIEVVVLQDRNGLEDADLTSRFGFPTQVMVYGKPYTPQGIYGGFSSEHCTGGFGAQLRANPSVTGVLVAGHCPDKLIAKDAFGNADEMKLHGGKEGRNMYGEFEITSPYEKTNGRMDIQFMVNPVWGGEPLFFAGDSSSVRPVYDTRSQDSLNEIGSRANPYGSRLCKYGKVTGQTCGNVYKKRIEPNYEDNQCNIQSNFYGDTVPTVFSPCERVYVELRGSGLRSERGDSGGPVFADSVAFGIHAGGGWAKQTDGSWIRATIFTPVDRFQDLGVDIMKYPY